MEAPLLLFAAGLGADPLGRAPAGRWPVGRAVGGCGDGPGDGRGSGCGPVVSAPGLRLAVREVVSSSSR